MNKKNVIFYLKNKFFIAKKIEITSSNRIDKTRYKCITYPINITIF